MVAAPKRNNSAHGPSSKSGSRKNKSAWRKNIDLSSVEDGLEDARAQERGGEGLFQLDTQGDEQQARGTKRPLKSLEILQNKSAVPPVTHSRARRNVVSATGEAEARARLRRAGVPPKAVRDQLRRAAGKVVTNALGGVVASEQKSLQDYTGAATVPNRDLWEDEVPVQPERRGSGPTSAAEKQMKYDPTWIEDPRNQKPKVPKTLAPLSVPQKETVGGKAQRNNRTRHHEEMKLARKAAAVPLPHPGMSYNPEAAEHEQLIHRAYDVEKAHAEEQEETARLRNLWQEMSAAEKEEVLAGNGATATTYYGMKIDVPPSQEGKSGSDSDEANASDQESEVDDEVALLREQRRQKAIKGKRKTTAQRHRHARAQSLMRQAAERKARNRLQNEAPAKLRDAHQRDLATQARLQAAQRRREAKLALLSKSGLLGQKIGGTRLDPTLGQGHESVQLPEQLSDNLRALKTEGNLFRERFQSLQTRALTEPARRRSEKQIKRLKSSRKQGWKEVERYAFRNFQ